MKTSNLAAQAATPPPAFQDFWVLLALIAVVGLVAVVALIVAGRALRTARHPVLNVAVDEVWQMIGDSQLTALADDLIRQGRKPGLAPDEDVALRYPALTPAAARALSTRERDQ